MAKIQGSFNSSNCYSIQYQTGPFLPYYIYYIGGVRKPHDYSMIMKPKCFETSDQLVHASEESVKNLLPQATKIQATQESIDGCPVGGLVRSERDCWSLCKYISHIETQFLCGKICRRVVSLEEECRASEMWLLSKNPSADN